MERHKDFTLSFTSAPPSVVAVRRDLAPLGVKLSLNATTQRPYELRVSFVNEVPVDKMTKTMTIAGAPVTIRPIQVVRSRGTIHLRELAWWSDQEIEEALGTSAKFLRRLSTRQSVAENSGRILLGFYTAAPPPDFTMPLIGNVLSVNSYVPNPTRCRNCQMYGHSESNCNRTVRCGRCGQPGHNQEDCQATPRCPACRGQHVISDRDCPVWRKERAKLRARDQTPAAPSTHNVRPNIIPMTEFPPIANPKRKRSSPSTVPLPKRPAQQATVPWASVVNHEAAPVTTRVPPQPDQSELILILQQQSRILEDITRTNAAILELLLRLVPPAAAQIPVIQCTATELPATTQIPVERPTAVAAPPPNPTTKSPNGRKKLKSPLVSNVTSSPSTSTVSTPPTAGTTPQSSAMATRSMTNRRRIDLGRDYVSSPTGPNFGTFDVREMDN